MKIGISRLWHEANSFASGTTDRQAFRSGEWVRGSEAIQFYKATATEVGGALAWQDEHSNTDLVFSRCAAAPPGGPVEQELLDEIISSIAEDAVFDDVDGLYVSLHGACIGTKDLSPETTLLKRLRVRFPNLKIAASFDMHCCPTEQLITMLDVATVYRRYPHTDMDLAAKRALDLLARVIETGESSQVVMVRTGVVLPSFNMRTDAGAPMTGVELYSEKLEQESSQDVLAVYPFASFAYADVPATNSGALVTTTDTEKGIETGQQLADYMSSVREAFSPLLPSAKSVLDKRHWINRNRIAILEPSDNPLSGGIADTTGLLKAALQSELPDGSVFAFFFDPSLVQKIHKAGLGAQIDVQLGGRLDRRFGEPVAVHAEVLCLTDGKFTNEGPMERGLPVALGKTAVLSIGPLRVIVTSACKAPNDPEYFNLHDVDLRTVPVLLAKAKNHFRAAFNERFNEIILVDTPGPAMANVSALPFQHVPQQRFDLSSNIGNGVA